jgi:outer membrane protein OmpA-like peptidoglycan-associated protein
VGIALRFVIAALALLAPAAASAQRSPVMLAIDADLESPVTTPATDRYYPGAGLSAAVLFAPYPFLLPSLRLRAAWFGDGPPPTDNRLADPGVGSLYTLTAGVRLRPEGFGQDGAEPEATGFWAQIDLGAALTGVLVRPTFELALGWAFDLGTYGDVGQIDLGPVVRLTHILQTEETGLDGSSTFVLTLGVEAVLFDAAPRPEEVAARARAREQAQLEQMDSDADGIDDADDACPHVAEDLDGWQDTDGCPENDDDGDGIRDADDACPHVAEDADGWRDEDGCPEDDNDGDGFADGVDACPNEPETVNGVDDQDGCPDEGLIELVGDRVVLEETVLFDLNRARVRHAARPILQAVVTLIHQHPEWRHLRIEGHADEQGEEEWNVELSQRRAAQVMRVLVELGARADMLESEGYGSSRPRMGGDSEEAYRANRRVEIIVEPVTGGAR